MIIARAPLRITLGGGGTDIPWFYEQYGGFCITAAINQYVYVTIHDAFIDDLILKYSSTERIKDIRDIQHPIFRETLKQFNIPHLGIEITSMADVPAGTGLGSSSTFTVALIKALSRQFNRDMGYSRQATAEFAASIEIDHLSEPIGKQDHYAAAYGGIRILEFTRAKVDLSHVHVGLIPISEETMTNLEEKLCLFFTGYSRSASAILQDQYTHRTEQELINNLQTTKEVGYKTYDALLSDNMQSFARLLNIQYSLKRLRQEETANDQIDEWYQLGISHGALGGKLVGAGGGGFLLFYAEDKASLRHAMKNAGLKELKFRFDFDGATTVTT